MSSRVLSALSEYLRKLTCKQACWSHPNKPKRWIVGQYYRKSGKLRNDRWVFGDRDTGACLPKPAWTEIVRHTLVKSGASPDDPALAGYWAQRRRKVRPPPGNYTVRLLSRQDGRCSLCGENLLIPDQPPQTPEGWERWFLRVTKKAIEADYLVRHDTPRAARNKEHTSCTPPAAGPGNRPGRGGAPRRTRRPEPPKRLAWAACAETCMRGPEGAPAQ